MPKYDFNKFACNFTEIALQQWVFSFKIAAYLQNTFS